MTGVGRLGVPKPGHVTGPALTRVWGCCRAGFVAAAGRPTRNLAAHLPGITGPGRPQCSSRAPPAPTAPLELAD